jgi:hypothetical protein
MSTLDQAFERLAHLVNEMHIGFETALMAVESQYRLTAQQVAQLRKTFFY